MMKTFRPAASAALSAALVLCAHAQTQVDLRTQTKNVDFSAASMTKPSRTGTSLPGTCTVGETFLLTGAPAGQNWYVCTTVNTWTVQGATLPSLTGSSGRVLSNNGTSLSWTSLGGDLSGSPQAATVTGLQGRSLSTTAPSSGQLLGWTGTQWTPQTVPAGVTNAFGRAGAITAQTGDYTFSQIAGTVGVGQLPAAGGDIAGTLTSATVAALQSRPVASTAPSSGQVLTWSGTQWAPQAPAGLVASVFGRTGVITGQLGDYTAAQVLNAVDLTAANVYNAGAKQSFTPSASTAGARVAPGALPAAPQAGDMAVDSGDGNHFKIYDGTEWEAVVPAMANYGASFTAQTSVSIPGTTHQMGTANLLVGCYDNATPAKMIEPDTVTVNPSSYDVTIGFATAQSGLCVVSGGGGGASGGGGTGAAGGDLAGTLSNAVVAKIQSRAVAATAPTAGQALVWNASSNRWEPQTVVTGSGGAGMAAQLGDLAVVRTSGTVLTIGSNCSTTTPCNVRLGSTVYSFTASATATLTAGGGTAYIYVDSGGNLTVGHNLTLTCSSTCVALSGVTAFPVNSVPVYTWTAAVGAWITGGGTDQRAFLSGKTVSAGAGVVAIDTGAQTTVAVDTTTVATYLTATATLAFPSIANGACAADMTISLLGTSPGDTVAAGWPSGLPAGLIGMMRASAADTVAVRLCNFSGSAATPPSATYRATVLRSF